MYQFTVCQAFTHFKKQKQVQVKFDTLDLKWFFLVLLFHLLLIFFFLCLYLLILLLLLLILVFLLLPLFHLFLLLHLLSLPLSSSSGACLGPPVLSVVPGGNPSQEPPGVAGWSLPATGLPTTASHSHRRSVPEPAEPPAGSAVPPSSLLAEAADPLQHLHRAAGHFARRRLNCFFLFFYAMFIITQPCPQLRPSFCLTQHIQKVTKIGTHVDSAEKFCILETTLKKKKKKSTL